MTRRFYSNGEMNLNEKVFYAKDHLGSVRGLTDSTGATRAKFDYDLWGNRTHVSGTWDTDVAYTGHMLHEGSGLLMAPYRAYNPVIGRWINRDPIAERGGLNLYGYVGNDPANTWDPLGLEVGINYTDGSRRTAITPQEFMDIINGSTDGSIDAIIVRGHANNVIQNFSNSNPDSNAGIFYDRNNPVMLVNEQYNWLAYLGELLDGKFDPNGSRLLTLAGCEVAKGKDNLAEATSRSLPASRVMGSAHDTGPWWWGMPISFGDKIYLNGKLK